MAESGDRDRVRLSGTIGTEYCLGGQGMVVDGIVSGGRPVIDKEHRQKSEDGGNELVYTVGESESEGWVGCRGAGGYGEVGCSLCGRRVPMIGGVVRWVLVVWGGSSNLTIKTEMQTPIESGATSTIEKHILHIQSCLEY